MRSRLSFVTIVSCILTCLASCGDRKETIQGTVTFDDQRVANGSIAFVSIEGEPIREGAVITDGQFVARLPPGTYRIELNAKRVIGTRKQIGFDGKEETLELTEELFPERYNVKSELKEVITPGKSVLMLNLKSKD